MILELYAIFFWVMFMLGIVKLFELVDNLIKNKGVKE